MNTICYHFIYWTIPDVRYQTSNIILHQYFIITISTLLITNLCVQEALYPASFQIFFFPFFYKIQYRWEPFTDFRSSLFQIRNQTEGLESECWGSEVSAPTHLKGPNKVSNRNLFTSHFPLFTFTRNSVIPVTNHSSDPLHMHSGISILIGLLCFQFPGTLVQ